LQTQVNDANFFSKGEDATKEILNELADVESKLEIAYSRWQVLDEL
jgi:ATP-binding cassette subfamily F protein uup